MYQLGHQLCDGICMYRRARTHIRERKHMTGVAARNGQAIGLRGISMHGTQHATRSATRIQHPTQRATRSATRTQHPTQRATRSATRTQHPARLGSANAPERPAFAEPNRRHLLGLGNALLLQPARARSEGRPSPASLPVPCIESRERKRARRSRLRSRASGSVRANVNDNPTSLQGWQTCAG